MVIDVMGKKNYFKNQLEFMIFISDLTHLTYKDTSLNHYIIICIQVTAFSPVKTTVTINSTWYSQVRRGLVADICLIWVP